MAVGGGSFPEAIQEVDLEEEVTEVSRVVARPSVCGKGGNGGGDAGSGCSGRRRWRWRRRRWWWWSGFEPEARWQWHDRWTTRQGRRRGRGRPGEARVDSVAGAERALGVRELAVWVTAGVEVAAAAVG